MNDFSEQDMVQVMATVEAVYPDVRKLQPHIGFSVTISLLLNECVRTCSGDRNAVRNLILRMPDVLMQGAVAHGVASATPMPETVSSSDGGDVADIFNAMQEAAVGRSNMDVLNAAISVCVHALTNAALTSGLDVETMINDIIGQFKVAVGSEIARRIGKETMQ